MPPLSDPKTSDRFPAPSDSVAATPSNGAGASSQGFREITFPNGIQVSEDWTEAEKQWVAFYCEFDPETADSPYQFELCDDMVSRQREAWGHVYGVCPCCGQPESEPTFEQLLKFNRGLMECFIRRAQTDPELGRRTLLAAEKSGRRRLGPKIAFHVYGPARKEPVPARRVSPGRQARPRARRTRSPRVTRAGPSDDPDPEPEPDLDAALSGWSDADRRAALSAIEATWLALLRELHPDVVFSYEGEGNA